MASLEAPVGYGRTQIDPWDSFRLKLIDLIDTDYVIRRELFGLSQSKIEKMQHDKDGNGFFKALDEYFEYSRQGVVDYLGNLTRDLYIDDGCTPVASLLREYNNQRLEYERQLEQIGISQSCQLIGRKSEITRARDILHSTQYQGVWICGMGGMGKSSLAYEVCRRLCRENWRIFKVELREQIHVRDLVRIALDVIGEPVLTTSAAGLTDGVLEYSSGDEDDAFEDPNVDFWRAMLIQKFCESSDKNKVLLLDGVDDILANDETEFNLFLRIVLERIYETEDNLHEKGKCRILITTRPRIGQISKLQNHLKEIVLKGLELNDAMEFLKEKSKLFKIELNEDKMTVVRSACGSCPLAMLSVLSTLKDIPVCQLMISLQSNQHTIVHAQNDALGVELCLRKSFSVLEEQYKITLMHLAVFRSSNFSIEAACYVCRKGFSGKAIMRLEIVSLKNRHLLESALDMENAETEKPCEPMCCYYIHPLVYRYLKNQITYYQNYVNDARKRFVEYIDQRLSKTTGNSLCELMKIDENFKSHVQLFISYVTEMPSLRPTFAEGPDLVGWMNREWITEWIIDAFSQCKYLIEIILESKRENKDLETVYYQTCLAKLYFDHYKFDLCKNTLNDILKIVQNNDTLSKEADYLKRKQKSKNVYSSVVLSKVWTMQARFFSEEEKYNEAEEHLKYALAATQKRSKECWSDRANIQNLLGIIFFKCKRYGEAETCHTNALNILSSHGGFRNEDIYLTNIGTALFKLADEDKSRDNILADAESYYSRALNVETSKPDNKARTLSLRGRLYLRLGRLDESQKDFQESLDIWKTIVQSPNINLISAYHYLSTLLLRKSTDLFKLGKITETSRVLSTVYNNYQEIRKQIEKGGFHNWQRHLIMYEQIKKNHRRIFLETNKEERDIEKLKIFYLDFEAGRFDKNGLQNHILHGEKDSSPLAEERNGVSNDNDDSSDSSSVQSYNSSVRVTSDEDEKMRAQTFKDISMTKIPENTLPEKRGQDNSQFRNQVDSGDGDSITSLSSIPESGNYWSTSSGSIDEDVFPKDEETIDDCRKRKTASGISKIKRQRHFDDNETRTQVV